MITAIAIFSEIILAAVIFSLWRRSKDLKYWLDEKDEQTANLRMRIDGLQIENARLCSSHTGMLLSGLGAAELEIVESGCAYELRAQYGCEGAPAFMTRSLLVKRFFFNPYDADDEAYARRCAEELKEKIEEDAETR